MTAPPIAAAPPLPRADPPALCGVSYVGARRIRVTRLDKCGRPAWGPKSSFVESGFTSIEIAPESEEGEDYTTKTAGGDLCIAAKGQDSIKWYTVAIEFCSVNYELFQMMNPTWRPTQDYWGRTTGVEIGQSMTDTIGFALEIWPKVTGTGSLCLSDEGSLPDDYEVNGYIVLPWLVGTSPDSWTLENGAATFKLNARTVPGSLWGRGPYNVMFDQNWEKQPLPRPVDPGFDVPAWHFTTSGDPTLVRPDITTLAPPKSTCGPVPLWNPNDIDPVITVAHNQQDGMKADLAVTNWAQLATKGGVIDWGGDNLEPTRLPATGNGQVTSPAYTTTTEKTITFHPANGRPPVTTTFTPVAPPATSDQAAGDQDDDGGSPAGQVEEHPHRARRSVKLTLTDPPEGQLAVAWGDEQSDLVTGAGPHHHAYTEAGTYPITVTDMTGQVITEQQVTVPFTGPRPGGQ